MTTEALLLIVLLVMFLAVVSALVSCVLTNTREHIAWHIKLDSWHKFNHKALNIKVEVMEDDDGTS